jgi:hypothetical protein
VLDRLHRRSTLAGWLPLLLLLLLGSPGRAAHALELEVEQLCRLFAHNRSGVIGMDAAYSVPLAAGRGTLWLFGDTLLGTVEPAGGRRLDGFERNSALITTLPPEAACSEPVSFFGSPDRAAAAVPSRSTILGRHRFFWPLDGFTTERGDTYLFFRRLRSTNRGIGFEGLRTELYRFEIASDGPKLEKLADLWGRDGEDHAFGMGAFYDPADRVLYVFGCRETDFERTGRFATCAVGRTPIHRIAQLADYRYFHDQEGWIADPNRATELFTDVAGELSVSWNSYLGSYLMVYSETLMSNVVLRTAPALTGPWSEPVEVFRCSDQRLDPGFGCYAGKEHPEWAEGDGQVIYLTYASNADQDTLLAASDLYWPHLLRVRLRHSQARE